MKVEEIKKIIKEKVLGKIKFVGDDDYHMYKFVDSGKTQPSVTTKLDILEKKFLPDYAVSVAFDYLKRQGFASIPNDLEGHLKNAQKERFRILEKAATIGTLVHEVIEKYIKYWILNGKLHEDITEFIPKTYVHSESSGISYDITSYSVTAGVRSAERWFKKNEDVIVPLFSEIRVGDDRYAAGTLDFVFYHKEKDFIGVIDWKTSNGVYDSHILQGVAYAKFLEHMTGLKGIKPYITHLSKKTDEYTVYYIPNITQAYSAFKRVCGVYDWSNNESTKFKKDKNIYDANKGKRTNTKIFKG